MSRSESAGDSTKCNLSVVSLGTNTFINCPKIINLGAVSSNDNPHTPLDTGNLASEQLKMNQASTSTPPDILFTGEDQDYSFEGFPPKHPDSMPTASPPKSYGAATLQQYDAKSGPIPLEGSPLEDVEWQDLLEFLKVEQERLRVLQEMSPMERFMTYDPRESSTVIEFRKAADEGY